MKNKILVIGSGAMGTAVAKVAYDTGYTNIEVYGVAESELKDLEQGKNTAYFQDTKLPVFKTTTDLKEGLEEADYIILAVPSKVMNIIVDQLKVLINKEVTIINVAKGFYPGTSLSLHEGISEELEGNQFIKGVVSLIGPSHAEEIVRDIPTIVAVVGVNEEIIADVQNLFNCEYFRTYMQTDVKGAEVGAAYKNVLAIASGISTGLGYGINTTAALLTRGIAEMLRFNDVMGGENKTIMGLTGIGDLIVTATSDLSRNFTFGKNLAKLGKEALNTKATVEGLVAMDNIYRIGQEKNLSLPIVETLYRIIHDEEDIHELVHALWQRKLKPE